jgi:hypothetical protein
MLLHPLLLLNTTRPNFSLRIITVSAPMDFGRRRTARTRVKKSGEEKHDTVLTTTDGRGIVGSECSCVTPFRSSR